MFWPLQSNSKILGVLEDSQVSISGMWMSSSHSSKSGVATMQLKSGHVKLGEGNEKSMPTYIWNKNDIFVYPLWLI